MRAEDIPMWAIASGIGHVVMHTNTGWISTACGFFMTGNVTRKIPCRICRKCRRMFPKLRTALAGKEPE